MFTASNADHSAGTQAAVSEANSIQQVLLEQLAHGAEVLKLYSAPRVVAI
jgi:hypothetical protein